MKISDAKKIEKRNEVKGGRYTLEKQNERLLTTDAKFEEVFFASKNNGQNEHVDISSTIICSLEEKINKEEANSQRIDVSLPKVNTEKNDDSIQNSGNLTKQEKRIKCDICYVALISKLALNRHMRLSHNNVLKYSCSTCGFQSADQQKLKKHEEIHIDSEHKNGKFLAESNSSNSDQMVGCSFCEKGFNSNSSLLAHKRSCQGHISQTVK